MKPQRHLVTEKNSSESENNAHGFTLVEVIVVIVIIGILAAIIAPNFTGYIHKLQVEDIVRQAKIMEDELSALTARQYAELGYMPSVSHQQVAFSGNGALKLDAGSQKVDEKNYVMLNRVNGGGAYSYCSTYGVGPFEYVTLANVQTGRGASATATEALRHSAGLTEFYKATGIDLSGSAERVPGSGGNNSDNSELERRWYAIQFYPRQDIASKGTVPYLTTRYLHPDQSYFAFYGVKYNGTWYLVMHNAKLSSAGSASWVSGGVAADPGKWNVYKNSNPTNFQYDNTGGKPFGVISD